MPTLPNFIKEKIRVCLRGEGVNVVTKTKIVLIVLKSIIDLCVVCPSELSKHQQQYYENLTT